MGGRRRLVTANGGAYGMTFGAGAPQAPSHRKGGCRPISSPAGTGVFEQGSLVIQDHRRKPLITMQHNGARFEGALTSSEVIWLER